MLVEINVWVLQRWQTVIVQLESSICKFCSSVICRLSVTKCSMKLLPEHMTVNSSPLWTPEFRDYRGWPLSLGLWHCHLSLLWFPYCRLTEDTLPVCKDTDSTMHCMLGYSDDSTITPQQLWPQELIWLPGNNITILKNMITFTVKSSILLQYEKNWFVN